MSWTALYMAGFQVILHGRFWVITEANVSAENQPGAEGALGEVQGNAEAADLTGRTQADRGSAESTVGKGEEGGLEEMNSS
jgi:hypothetical protein